MAKIETYRCDGCGAVKGETNHWWLAIVVPYGKAMLVQPFDGCFELEGEYAGRPRYSLHLCGQDCVNRKLAEVMK